MRLQGKKALVTGAGRGIGRGIALEFAKNGADLVICDINEDNLEHTRQEVQALGVRCVSAAGNVAESQAVQHMVQTCMREYGRIDILAHAAGILRSCAVVEQDEKDWDTVVAVNLRSTFLLCKYAGRHMIEQRYGKMVLIDSCASKTGEAFNAVYCASKAGVRLLAHSLALELAPYGINVNSLAPGTINTEMIQTCLHDRAPLFGKTFEEYLEEFHAGTPLGRMGEPQEIGKLAVFLASEDASFITGTSVNISGGKECH